MSQRYICPMHSDTVRYQPGICSECGMRLIEERKGDREKRVERDSHAGHSLAMFARKFWISLVLTIPVVLYSELPRNLLGFEAPTFPGSSYLSLVMGSVVFFYGGWVFLVGAWHELKGRLPGMMTLIALAITAAYGYSVFAVLISQKGTLFWELTTLITVMLLGHWLEMKAVRGAQSALKELSKLLPDTAELVTSGQETKLVPLADLKVGDLVLVRPGGKIPADGLVKEGQSEVNEAMITGESRPVTKTVESEVIAGTINGDGTLLIRVSRIGEHTFLAGVIRLVAEAQASKSRLQILSDRAAFYLTVIAVITGLVTLFGWLILGAGPVFAVERLVAVLVIACPHALGLAVPLVASISTTLAARNGFLVRQRLALELARKIDAILFDKTGTLTKGEYGVDRIILNDSAQGGKIQMPIEELLKLAAAVDSKSEHFAAKAIVREAKSRGLVLPAVEDFRRLPGKGVSGRVEDSEILAGGEAVLTEGIVVGVNFQTAVQENARLGKTAIYVLKDSHLLGAIVLADLIREESRQAVANLKRLGIKTAMVTGDSDGVARWVAGELGVDEYFARVLPQEKAEKVKILQGQGLKVAMVGDGINDAPALMQADLGIAIGAGTNVAIESAGIILVRNDPRDIVKIIQLSRRTYSKMLQNLFWATGYNVVALPLAAGVLAAQGIILQPALAAVFMSLSTVIVAINALFLKNVKFNY